MESRLGYSHIACKSQNQSEPFDNVLKRLNFARAVIRHYAVVGASHGNLPHAGNTGDQVTITQIGIQATAR
jgi:hypothetical protein